MPYIFTVPPLSYIKIELHYQGRIVNRIFYRQHLNLFESYPSYTDIMTVRSDIIATKVAGVVYTLIVFEEGIYIIET